MKIKKLGHCCLVVEVNGKKVMTDPGTYTKDTHSKELGINLILITHEHFDHLHIDSLKEVLRNNPKAIVVTNSGVGKLLDEADIKYQKLEDKQIGEFAGVDIEGHGNEHAEIFEYYSRVQNTGYFIGKKLFYPGDAFINPNKPVEILALPVVAPWLLLKQSILYAKDLKPRICFPMHDWNIKLPGIFHKLPSMFLPKFGIEFKVLEENKEEEF